MNTVREENRNTDYVLWLVVALASVASLVYFVHYFSLGETMFYVDSQSHLLIARRVIDNNTGGISFAQLGGVWLPLTHVLAIPFVANDFLYHTAIAGSLLSMVSFVLTALFIYKIVRLLSKSQFAGFVGAFVLISNQNALYMQSTAMTELPLYLFTTASVYFLLKVAKQPENMKYIFWASLCIALGTGVRYEAWIVLMLEAALIGYVFLRSRFGFSKSSAFLFIFCLVAFAGVLGWLYWNSTIFGNALEFQNGEYAKPALWVSATDPVIGNLRMAFDTYFLATLHNTGILFYLSLIGAGVFAVKTRLNFKTLAPFVLFAIFPAFVGMLYLGQRPLKVPELSNGDMYNTRFALYMLLSVAVFVGYLAKYKIVNIVLLVLVFNVSFSMSQQGIIALQDPALDQSTVLRQTQGEGGVWFRQCYSGGSVLLESYGNEKFQFDSQVSLNQYIYEGSYKLWLPALEAPWKFTRWVVMRGPTSNKSQNKVAVFTDKVWTTWRDKPEFVQRYQLIYRNAGMEIWQLKSDLAYTNPSPNCTPLKQEIASVIEKQAQ